MTPSPQVGKGSPPLDYHLVVWSQSNCLHWHPRARKIPCYCWARVGVLAFAISTRKDRNTFHFSSRGLTYSTNNWRPCCCLVVKVLTLHLVSSNLSLFYLIPAGWGPSLDSPGDLHQHVEPGPCCCPREPKALAPFLACLAPPYSLATVMVDV